ncbi:MAG: hypothetical protein HRU11_13540 [Parvularculaceae bacterium]|nr:hypothetical protein [Parvularculaceae bacterium]
MRYSLPAILFAAAACASGNANVSESEAELLVLAQQKTKGARFPVLGSLPGDAPGPQDFAPEMGPELRSRAIELVSLAETAGRVDDPVTTQATVAELLMLVDDLQNSPSVAAPILEAEALDFPTPPPLN